MLNSMFNEGFTSLALILVLIPLTWLITKPFQAQPNCDKLCSNKKEACAIFLRTQNIAGRGVFHTVLDFASIL